MQKGSRAERNRWSAGKMTGELFVSFPFDNRSVEECMQNSLKDKLTVELFNSVWSQEEEFAV